MRKDAGSRRPIARTSKVRLTIQEMLHRARIEASEARAHQVATSEILNIIARSPEDEQPVFDAIAENARRLLGAIDAAVYRVVDDMLHLAAFTSASQAGDEALRSLYPAPVGSTNAGRAVQMRAPSVRGDVEGDPDIHPKARAVARARGYRSMLAVPMLHRGVGIGSISVSRQEKGPFRDHHIALLETFADQAVIAIENVWLFKVLQSRTDALGRSTHRLKTLSEVGRVVSSTPDLEKALQTIVQSAVRLAGLDGGAIYEYDERAEEFRLLAANQLAPELLESLRRVPIRKGEGTVGGIAVTLEAAQVPDILFDIYQSSHKERMIEVGYRAVLTVPLLGEDRVIGALSVSRRAPGQFDPEVVELLKAFAAHCSVAIQKARLVREVAEQGRLLESTRQRDAPVPGDPASSTALPQRTHYDILGGDEPLRRLVDRFYALMDEEPEYYPIRKLHPESLEHSALKLHHFLSGWLGGPPLYAQRMGPPMLRARHQPYSIGKAERDLWLACMKRALEECEAGTPEFRAWLLKQFSGTADWMRNRPGDMPGT